MSAKLLIFGGTFEGRMLAEGLSRKAIPACVFTATDYGGSLVQSLPHIQVYAQRLNAEEMRRFMEHEGITRVIDATHPYAKEVTKNIIQAAKEAGVEYIRVIREEDPVVIPGRAEQHDELQRGHQNDCQSEPHGAQERGPGGGGRPLSDLETGAAMEVPDEAHGEGVMEKSEPEAPPLVRVADSAEAVAYLAATQGAVLLTTGSKELDVFCSLPDFEKRLFVRVLPMAEVIERCFALGYGGKQIIAMQGPFSYTLNVALLRHYDCRYLVTKNTSQAGGMDEKIAAARDNDVTVVLIERPVQESGLTLAEAFVLLGITKE